MGLRLQQGPTEKEFDMERLKEKLEKKNSEKKKGNGRPRGGGANGSLSSKKREVKAVKSL